MTNSNIPATASTAALTALAAKIPPADHPTPVVETEAMFIPASKSYQFPSAPTTIEFQHKNKRVAVPDGVYRTSDAKEIAELDTWVDCGNIYPFTGDITSPSQVPPKPIDPTAESN